MMKDGTCYLRLMSKTECNISRQKHIKTRVEYILLGASTTKEVT